MIDVKITNRFGQLSAEVEKAVQRVIRKTAFDIEREAKILTPVDTGFLRASIYTLTYRGGNMKSAARQSLGRIGRTFRRIGKIVDPGEFLEADAPDTPYEALVAVGAEYGIYVEYGTLYNRAQPFMTPAADSVKSDFERDMAKAMEGK